MHAIVVLFAAFATIALVGTLLAAVHDHLEAVVVRRPAQEPRSASRLLPPQRALGRYQRSQFDGATTLSARAKMYSTAALKPAGRVSRWRAPDTLT
jgi:hypothetical protein